MKSRLPERAVTVSRGDECLRGQFHAMASPCEVLCRTDDETEVERLAELVAAEVWRIEDKFSRYLDGNVVSQVNSAAGKLVNVDPETAQLLDFAQSLHEISAGKFDITSGVLRRVWNFDGGDELPSEDSVSEVLGLVGWHRASWSSPVLQLDAGMEIDFGGIGKEYAVDRATTIMREETEFSCLVNLGGDLAVNRRSKDGQAWTVGIESISSATRVPASLLSLQVGALATSGDARRFLKKEGVRYSHILDSRTGWPIVDAPHSITIAADTCTQAGMLCTLGMLEGRDAEDFLSAQGVDFWCER